VLCGDDGSAGIFFAHQYSRHLRARFWHYS
jgi:hypothetical protein